MQIITESYAETKQIGRALGSLLGAGDIVALYGDLGAGKTAFSQGIAAGMGIEDAITSPTYLVIKVYPADLPLYHIDTYRLEGSEDLVYLGYEEFFFGTGVTVIEWAEKISDLLPEERLDVNIEVMGEFKRKLKFTGKGKLYMRLLEELEKNVDTCC